MLPGALARSCSPGLGRYYLCFLKALQRALWAPLVFGLAACLSGAPSADRAEPAQAVTEPIIGGHLDTTTKGVVALAFEAHSQVSVFCSGSLLAPNLVLTARHCIARIGDGSSDAVRCPSSQFTASYDPQQIFVSTDSQPEPGGRLYAVQEIRQAPGSNQVCGYDVALLILSGAGVPGTVATPVEPALDTSTLAKLPFSAVGYGLQDPKDKKGTTAGTRMRFDSSSVYCVGANCPAAAATEADEFVGNSPVCSGDSGGPALDAQGRVFGVTSRGDAACTYALYSSVASWAGFLRSAALDAAASGGYPAPGWAQDSASTQKPGANGGAGGGSSGAGTEIAGSAGTLSGAPPPAQVSTPTVDPLGASCASTSDCPGNYQCYSATGMPPGVCVPPCSSLLTSCPDRYSCTESLGVCTPAAPSGATASLSSSSSCALSSRPEPGRGALATFLVLGSAWLGRRRRRAGGVFRF
jgi:V8-like Glu-specific endopeptidase